MPNARFDEEFRTRLWDTIAEIENHSCVEIVTILRTNSAEHWDALWGWGAISAFVVFTVMMFSPVVYGDYLLYLAPLCGFLAGWIAALKLPVLRKVFISKKRRCRQVEIMARAIFQKGGIRHTSAKIGILIYGSLFERMIYVLPDRGAAERIPQAEWTRIKQGFQKIFRQPKAPEAFLAHLQSCQPIFSRYLPSVDNDINELPDNLQVDI